MKKLSLIISTLLVSISLVSQTMILHDPVTGRVFNSEKYSDIKGSAFLYDKWINGSVTTSKGIYNNLQLKFDVYNNILFFNKDDQAYEFQDPVKSFTLIPAGTDTLFFEKGLSGNGINPQQFAQVLVQGRINLYKSDIKLLSELNEINTGVVKVFNTSSRYFIMRNNTTYLVKLNKKEFFDVMKDKEEKVQAYMNENKLAMKKQSDFVNVLKYYNSL